MTVPEDVHRTIQTYVSAWNEPDETVSRQLFERSWAEDGTYTDPFVHIEGLDALVQHSRQFFVRWPGAKIILTSGVIGHHGKVCFTWRVVGLDKRTLREGIDFGELAEDGRLQRVVGFFNPLAKLEEASL